MSSLTHAWVHVLLDVHIYLYTFSLFIIIILEDTAYWFDEAPQLLKSRYF